MKIEQFLTSPIRESCPARRVLEGDLYGIELEMEGRNLAQERVQGWNAEADGSLRMHHGEAIEWVTNLPSSYEKTIKKLDALYGMLDRNGAKIVVSNRTSTHVHVNMTDKRVYQLVNLYAAYTVLEDLLTKFSGETRDGNLFCVGMKYSPQYRQMFADAIRNKSFAAYGKENRYAGFNLSSLNKFCTIEFRTMRGCDNVNLAKQWLNILHELCQYAFYDMQAPHSLLEKFSMLGCRDTVYEIFTKANADVLLEGWNDHEVSQSMLSNGRNIQLLCYEFAEGFDRLRHRAKRQIPDFWQDEAGDLMPQPVDMMAPPPQMLRVRAGQFANQAQAVEWVQLRQNNPGVHFDPAVLFDPAGMPVNEAILDDMPEPDEEEEEEDFEQHDEEWEEDPLDEL